MMVRCKKNPAVGMKMGAHEGCKRKGAGIHGEKFIEHVKGGIMFKHASTALTRYQ